MAEPDALTDGSYAITATASTGSGGSSATLQTTPIAPASPGSTTQEWRNYSAFAALKDDGSVVTWGPSWAGGDSSAVSTDLESGVTQLFSNYYAFAALKDDGSVITWGPSWAGGDSSAVSSQLSSGVSQLFSTIWAFAALKDDGSVITWGISGSGGDSSAVSSQLSSGVSQLFSTYYAFAALKDDGSVITWGYSSYGGDSSAVSSQLSSGVVSFADPFQNDRLVTGTTTGSGLTSDPSPALTLTIDATAPTFTSAATADAIDENSGAGQLIYTAATTDDTSVSYSLKAGNNDDADAFSIDAATGDVTLLIDPDYETQSAYAFTVVATDAAGNSSEQAVTLAVNDLDDTPPAAPSTPDLIAASDSGQSDTDNLTSDPTPTVTGTAEAGSSVELFAGNTSLGTTTTDGNGTWSLTVPGGSQLADGTTAITATATDSAGNSSDPSPALTLTIDTTAPSFSSAGTAAAIDENSGANQLIYTATASDTTSVTYSLKPGNNDDAAAFSIDSTSGQVTLDLDPDYESQSSYTFTVVATDSTGNTSEQAVALAINDQPEGLNLSINGTTINAPLSSYSSQQDIDSDAVLSNGDSTLTLTGNTWTKADLLTGSSPNGYTITEDTFLSLSFDSSVEGEIQGIGFDNDDIISPDKTFQLAGSQSWGLQNYRNYTTGSGQQTYTIPVGQSYTGSFRYLTFLNDDDIPNDPLATDSFSNIQLFENFL